ncbi:MULTISPECIES: NUDIX hydrolase [unclassified Actinomyces]|uniref:NUDIX domain-containing protein n=1 Tax=unclassified Actinomyces TaxID=2609248 RepID=UPI00201711C6|nr:MULTISPECIES: NUDIX hydrolase [unclassified Actinomyces]MCL3777904.1 NUDIX hydrolase [Actinomyces sp. AC-20-1]MCL3788784.1 NUDIX hydrolase [Actinomyces sp. 187325]MCL3791120.1 NUDIX hydrolase [Actinomyces sp. 186855]MCL3793681.1 NUDIX hydrolase [Actinomyces sp. 217892]
MGGYPTGSAGQLRDERDVRPVSGTVRAWTGPICAVDDELVHLAPEEAPVRRQTVLHHDAVTVVALREGQESSQEDGAAEILMVRQYRHPVRARLWEIPAGLLDVEDEEPVVAAQRELAEETDHEAARWHVLADYFASPGFTTEGVRCFLARDLSVLTADRRTVREAEEAEFVPAWFRLDDVVTAVLGGGVHNPATVVGALAAQRARDLGWRGLREPDAPRLNSPVSL